MAGTNKNIADKAFKDFKKVMEHETQREVELYAQNILFKAIEFRMKDPNAHNFTGNLLNSIVVAVYLDKDLKKAFFSGETGIRQPRYYEMTASHGRYHFKVDYEGKESNFTPEIETLRRKGLDDAYEFVSTYSPGINGFVVVVAYTTEYADFVQMQRGTTGYINTRRYAEKVAMQKFLLPSKAA